MSTATVDAAAAPKKGKKKLLVIVLAALLLLGGAAGAALFWLKHKAAAEHAQDDEDAPAPAHAARDPHVVPAFVPLDVFTVNLADREADRYAQVGITFELSDPKEADRIKNFMPVIRNNILMLLANKTSAELLAREGKVQLAREVRRETSLALGVAVDDEDDEAHPGGAGADGDAGKKKARRHKARTVSPVAAVHFNNFIIQ